MKTNRTVILTALFAVALLLGLFFTLRGEKGILPGGNIEVLVSKVERVQIGKDYPIDAIEKSFLITFVRVPGEKQTRWLVPDLGNRAADNEEIKKLLETTYGVAGTLQTKKLKVENFATDESRLRVALYDGQWKPILTLLVGTKDISSGKVLVIEEFSKRTALTNASLLTREIGRWLSSYKLP